MAQSKIPIRPQGRYKLSAEQCDCLTWYLLKGCTQAQAYGLFVRTDLVFQKSLLRTEAQQFFSSAEAVAYLKAYEYAIGNAATQDNAPKSKEIDAKELEQKKLSAIKALVTWATEKSVDIDNLDEDTATLVLKVADKVGLFDDMEKAEEKPRRYLPVRCQSECQYRLFVEQNIKNGNMLNECDYCKARAFAEKQGFKYDATKNLNIPSRILKEYNIENYSVIDDDTDN